MTIYWECKKCKNYVESEKETDYLTEIGIVCKKCSKKIRKKKEKLR